MLKAMKRALLYAAYATLYLAVFEALDRAGIDPVKGSLDDPDYPDLRDFSCSLKRRPEPDA